MAEDNGSRLQAHVAEVAAAFFANSHVGTSEIGTVIDQIAKSLASVGTSSEPGPAAQEEATAATRATPNQVKRSITPEALISFEDGRPYKTLRRHLAVKGLTPEQYREKWGLPTDYPMVAAGYSATRSELAKKLGLGARRAAAAPAPRRRRSPSAGSDA